MPLRYRFVGPRGVVERPPSNTQSAGASDSLAGNTMAQGAVKYALLIGHDFRLRVFRGQ